MDRRTLLRGMAGILATSVAPAAIGSGILMPVRKIITPQWFGMRQRWVTLEEARAMFPAHDQIATTPRRQSEVLNLLRPIYSGGPFAPASPIRFQEKGDDFGIFTIDARKP